MLEVHLGVETDLFESRSLLQEDNLPKVPKILFVGDDLVQSNANARVCPLDTKVLLQIPTQASRLVSPDSTDLRAMLLKAMCGIQGVLSMLEATANDRPLPRLVPAHGRDRQTCAAICAGSS